MFSLIHFRLFFSADSISFPTYLIVMSLVYSISTVWIFSRSRAIGLDPRIAMDISIAIMIGGLVGSRLVHVVYEHPEYYLKYPQEIYRIWNGGFVFYGGLIGGFGLAYLIVKIKKQDPLRWMDAFAPILPVGYGVGRLGCLFAGCCYGRACDLPWAIKYPEGVEAPAHIGLHPTPIYEAVGSLAIFVLVYLAEKYKFRFPERIRKQGFLFYIWMILYSIHRIIIEDFRNDFRGPAVLGFSISTWLSLLMITVGLFLILNETHRRKR